MVTAFYVYLTVYLVVFLLHLALNIEMSFKRTSILEMKWDLLIFALVSACWPVLVGAAIYELVENEICVRKVKNDAE